MSDLHIDYSRAEADRRMRLLEMASGDLDKAIKMDCWVRCGVTDPNAPLSFVPSGQITTTIPDVMGQQRSISNTDDLSIPPHLRRTA